MSILRALGHPWLLRSCLLCQQVALVALEALLVAAEEEQKKEEQRKRDEDYDVVAAEEARLDFLYDD